MPKRPEPTAGDPAQPVSPERAGKPAIASAPSSSKTVARKGRPKVKLEDRKQAFNLTLPTETLKRLDRLVERIGTTRSALVAMAISRVLEDGFMLTSDPVAQIAEVQAEMRAEKSINAIPRDEYAPQPENKSARVLNTRVTLTIAPFIEKWLAKQEKAWDKPVSTIVRDAISAELARHPKLLGK